METNSIFVRFKAKDFLGDDYIVARFQSELDVNAHTEKPIHIQFGSAARPAELKNIYNAVIDGYYQARAYNSHVVSLDLAKVVAYGGSDISAFDSSIVFVKDDCIVNLYDWSIGFVETSCNITTYDHSLIVNK